MNNAMISRRNFLQTTVGAAGAALVPGADFLSGEPIPSAAQAVAPSDRVRFGSTTERPTTMTRFY